MKSKGGFSTIREGNVCVAHVHGVWDERIAKEYAIESQKLIRQIDGAPWVHLVYMNNWVLGTPQIEPIIGDFSTWAKANNLRHSAFIYRENTLKTYQIDRMMEKAEGPRIREIFTSEKDAVAWLNGNGFSIPMTLLERAAAEAYSEKETP